MNYRVSHGLQDSVCVNTPEEAGEIVTRILKQGKHNVVVTRASVTLEGGTEYETNPMIASAPWFYAFQYGNNHETYT